MDVDQLPRDRLSDESVSCSEATHTQTKGILHGFDGTKSRFPQATSAASVGPELPSSQFPSEQQWHPDFPHSASLGLGFAQHFAGTECACGACRHNDTVVHRGRDGMQGRESTGCPQHGLEKRVQEKRTVSAHKEICRVLRAVEINEWSRG